MAAASAVTPATADRVPYVVETGDTLSELARLYILPEYDWRDLMRVAKVGDPKRLPVRRTLSLPRAWLRWKAEKASFASVRGTVTVLEGNRRVTPVAGTTLSEGAVISTAANSFATLVLADGSRIALPSQSQVTVGRLRRLTINGAMDYRFDLARGRIGTRAAPLKGPSERFRIQTPLAMTSVRGTEFDVGLDAEQRSVGTGVFEGSVAVSAADGSPPVLVPARQGAITDRTGRSQTVELLEAPALQNPGRVQSDELVQFDLIPVPGAAGYRLELASDAGFVDRYREEYAALPQFSIADVPNGNQFVRISALAENGLGGLRQSYAFTRRLASIRAEAEATPDGYRFKWFGAGEGERRYRLQIFKEKIESAPIIDEVGLTRDEAIIRNLPAGTYLWRVAVAQVGADGEIENWTEPEKLVIASPGGG